MESSSPGGERVPCRKRQRQVSPCDGYGSKAKIPSDVNTSRCSTSDDETGPAMVDVPAKVEEVTTSSKRIRKKLKKAEEPLPDPFQLPENYRPDVEVALRSGQMTVETRKAFLSQVAASIFTKKRYPTREEFQRVALGIVRQYPFLESPVPGSTKTVSLLTSFSSLVDTFQCLHFLCRVL